MKIGVFGTGVVGTTLASKLVALGHEVMIGSRDSKNEKAGKWVESVGGRGSAGTFADAARFAEIVINATSGAGSVDAVRAAGEENLRGKTLADVSNALDFSKGMPPSLFTAAAGDSLGERIQAELPETHVVKALNTINASVMVEPSRVNGVTDVFVAGDDAEAKEKVSGILRQFGWSSIVDVGGIQAARGLEAYVLFWLQLMLALKTSDFNIRITR
jgi:predicted dinucleotide-binding enzyme